MVRAQADPVECDAEHIAAQPVFGVDAGDGCLMMLYADRACAGRPPVLSETRRRVIRVQVGDHGVGAGAEQAKVCPQRLVLMTECPRAVEISDMRTRER